MQQVPHAHLRFVVDDVLVVAELLRGVPLDFSKWHFRVERPALAAPTKAIALRIREESRLGIGPQNTQGADAVLAGTLAVLGRGRHGPIAEHGVSERDFTNEQQRAPVLRRVAAVRDAFLRHVGEVAALAEEIAGSWSLGRGNSKPSAEQADEVGET